MAFDRTKQSDIDALWVEVTTDPALVLYVQTQTRNVINGLNLNSRNPVNDRAPLMFTPRLILTHITAGQIDAADFTSDGRKYFFDLVMRAAETDMDTNLDEFRSSVLNVLPDGTGKTALAAADEKIPRGQVFFADNRYYIFENADWEATRDNHT